MAQPQQQPPARAFSPTQHSPSPVAAQSGFALPPNKRVRTDGPGSQPGSPYSGSPYSGGTGAAGSPSSTFWPRSPTSSGQNTPYTNGHNAQGLNLPDARAGAGPPPIQTQQSPPLSIPNYNNATMAPVAQAIASPAQTPNVMGPPQRPADRPTKDYEYDVTDSLAGTGIDLRAEEQYMSELYSTALDTNAEARTGFPQHPAGGKSSFYGSGMANQPAESISEQDQKQYAIKAAEQAFAEASMRLAVQRTQEINDPFLLVANLHRRAERVARENHVGLNLDLRNNQQTMGRMRMPEQFPVPKVAVRMEPGPDSTMVQTTGSYIPQDAFLVDQLALMSIATKLRLRELVEDASAIAVNRQKTSHGEVPDEWAAASAPLNVEVLGMEETTENGDVEGVAGHETAPLKRKRDESSGATAADKSVGSAEEAGFSNGVKPAKKMPKITSSLTATMRELARQEREWEEARLRKRQKRKDGLADSAATPSRSGSVGPGTPGSVAPEGDKPMTKKEMKKNQALKAAEANSHANQNITSSMFAGLGGRSGLFGKKKTNKTYDWMNVGRGGSGASTPTRPAPGGGKGINGTPGTPGQSSLAMTTEGRNRLGTWREDKEKGRNIQLRDWVIVLERDGRESKALQRAYSHLDSSNPR